MRSISLSILLVGILSGLTLRADPVVINFDGLIDGDLVTTQFSGLTFSNAVVLTAGISLNELEFPPKSGGNVVSDLGGPISILFASPVLSFGGFFTYAIPLSLGAFDAGKNLVVSATSLFSSNLALSGVAGSSPNEFLEVTSALGISSITITGDPLGGSFVLDDATITPLSQTGTPVPEPGTISLLIAGSVALAGFLKSRKR